MPFSVGGFWQRGEIINIFKFLGEQGNIPKRSERRPCSLGGCARRGPGPITSGCNVFKEKVLRNGDSYILRFKEDFKLRSLYSFDSTHISFLLSILYNCSFS